MGALAAIVFPALLWYQGGPTFEGDTLLVEERFLGSFQRATRIVTNSRGQILVLDEGRDLLFLLESDRERFSVGGRGWDGSSFDRPAGIATDGLNIYVADYGNHRISRFDRRLTFVSALSTRDTSYAPARFGFPAGVALSRQGDLFVLDGENARIVKFTTQSRFQRSFGGERESMLGRLRNPREILVSRQDRVLVLEENRIVEYDFAGNFVRELCRGVFSGATGFSETKSGFIVCLPEKLFWIDSNGTVSTTINLAHVLSEFPLIPAQDVVAMDDSILILTPERIGQFRLVH